MTILYSPLRYPTSSTETSPESVLIGEMVIGLQGSILGGQRSKNLPRKRLAKRRISWPGRKFLDFENNFEKIWTKNHTFGRHCDASARSRHLVSDTQLLSEVAGDRQAPNPQTPKPRPQPPNHPAAVMILRSAPLTAALVPSEVSPVWATSEVSFGVGGVISMIRMVLTMMLE